MTLSARALCFECCFCIHVFTQSSQTRQRNPVVLVQSRFDTSHFDTSRSQFVAHVKSIRYKLTLLEVVLIQNTILYIND